MQGLLVMEIVGARGLEAEVTSDPAERLLDSPA
jgi:hypothetical protein